MCRNESVLKAVLWGLHTEKTLEFVWIHSKGIKNQNSKISLNCIQLVFYLFILERIGLDSHSDPLACVKQKQVCHPGTSILCEQTELDVLRCFRITTCEEPQRMKFALVFLSMLFACLLIAHVYNNFNSELFSLL